MNTEQDLELEPLEAEDTMPEPSSDPLEDTDRIQKAIEKVVDEETAALPPLPLSGISDSPEDFSDEPWKDYSEYPETSRGDQEASLANAGVHTWFFTFMCMNIPIVGWIYLLYLAFNKQKTDRRNFARAYLFYKLVFLLVSAVILGILFYIGLGYLDQLLTYMEML